jgi:two-component system chemotaxis sensor kinase CheA
LWGNRFVLGILWLIMYGAAYSSGGPRGPSVYWTTALPVMAMMTISVKESLRWLASIVIMPIALTVIERMGWQFPAMRSLGEVQLLHALAIVMLGSVLFSLAFAYESARAAMAHVAEQVNSDMRLVLENVDQGFVTITTGNRMSGMRSAIADAWLGRPATNDTFSDWVGRVDPNTGGWLRVGIEAVFEDCLPVELTVAQLPRHLSLGERSIELSYRPVSDHTGSLHAVVAILSDATERLHAERTEVTQREQSAVFMHLARDRAGVLHFFREADELIEQLSEPGPSAFRLVHTLKGNAGIFGLNTFAAVCHAVESNAQAEARWPTDDELLRVRSAWHDVKTLLAALLTQDEPGLAVVEADLVALEQAIAAGTGQGALLRMLAEWRHERAEIVLGRMAEQASALARRLGRCEVRTEVSGAGLRFDRVAWGPVWSAMVHAVRNAVDHGGEPSDVRSAQGKPAAMTIVFSCAEDKTGIQISVSDDGCGIDWERVRERAIAAGLPQANQADLHEALFADGLSTRQDASEFSGRGVGLGALREACHALGAQVTIHSERGRGTRLEIFWSRLRPSQRQTA